MLEKLFGTQNVRGIQLIRLKKDRDHALELHEKVCFSAAIKTVLVICMHSCRYR